jgi:hypothetical protein
LALAPNQLSEPFGERESLFLVQTSLVGSSQEHWSPHFPTTHHAGPQHKHFVSIVNATFWQVPRHVGVQTGICAKVFAESVELRQIAMPLMRKLAAN